MIYGLFLNFSLHSFSTQKWCLVSCKSVLLEATKLNYPGSEPQDHHRNMWVNQISIETNFERARQFFFFKVPSLTLLCLLARFLLITDNIRRIMKWTELSSIGSRNYRKPVIIIHWSEKTFFFLLCWYDENKITKIINFCLLRSPIGGLSNDRQTTKYFIQLCARFLSLPIFVNS